MLAVAGLNHRSAPIQVRERFHLDGSRVSRLASELVEQGAVGECLLFSTCNRTECYFTAEEAETAARAVVERLAREAGFPAADAGSYFFVRHDMEAVAHLFRVVAGLDSLVVGEPQIQGQVRDAYEAGRQVPRSLGPVLHRLFQTALAAGGRVRAGTGISTGSASIPSAAVELARKVFGSLEGRVAMVLGAGKMGELTLRCLREAGVRELLVASRRYRRASAAGRRAGGEAVPYEEFWERLPDADLLVTSVAAPHPMVGAERLRSVRSREGPLVVLDIALPRNVEPEAGDLPDVFLYNIDDLQRVVESTEQARAGELPAADAILQEHAERFWGWVRARRAVPLIRELRERAEGIRRRELDAVLARIESLTDEERERIHMASRAALNKILHAPTAALRRLAREAEGEELLRAARRLFGPYDAGEAGDDGREGG